MKPLIANRPVALNRFVRCQSPRDPIWLALADTHRLNRAIGNQPLHPEPITDGASRYLVRTRLAGLNLRYEEEPFEWIRPKSMSITRQFQNGPAVRYTYQLFLSDDVDGGCQANIRLTVLPRHPIFWPFVYLNTAAVMRALVREVGLVDERLQSGCVSFVDPPKSPVRRAAFERATLLLNQAIVDQPELVAKLTDYVAEAPDALVNRLRPFALADQWKVDRRETLRVCLHAVVAGLLELSWDIICPSCRTVATKIDSLNELADTSHCHFCDLSIRIELDRAVEATFRPSAAVRQVEDSSYCIGGPFRTPHVVVQRVLPALAEISLAMPADEGRYRLFVRGGAVASVTVDTTAPSFVRLYVDDKIEPAHVSVGPLGELRVVDTSGADRHLKLEHLEWASAAATAIDVSTMNVFGRFFSSQVLRPGVAIRLAKVALLFTDLTGSTAMYASQGDGPAYRFVMEHFDILRTATENHHGTLVKTIGDAVMAAFADEIDAVKAAVKMQRQFQRFVSEQYPTLGVGLRIGVYCGPCYSINANESLDYFGQAVNVASRLESEAETGEIVLAAQLWDRAEAEHALRGATKRNQFAAKLKGLEQPLLAVRLVVGEPSGRNPISPGACNF